MARELVDTVRKNVSIDRAAKENVRAALRRLVKRILRKHRQGHPGTDAVVLGDHPCQELLDKE